MYTLKLKHHFDSAHKLNLDYESKCKNIHGHRWTVEVTIITEELNGFDMIIDFTEIKRIINELDHCYLNDKLDFNPTAERLSFYLYNKIKELFTDDNTKIKVQLFESPDASITYEN
jgi:6-pyruvoyltetrahydropterin/6-carboxytetrahydropterin synthase